MQMALFTHLSLKAEYTVLLASIITCDSINTATLPPSQFEMESKPKIVTPFLMFQGNAHEALAYYTKVIPDSKIESITQYGPDEAGKEGAVKLARACIGGLDVMIYDSPVEHSFGFTPSISLYVELSDEGSIAAVTKELEEGGKTLMPLDNYGFSRKFAWVTDRWGVSWQLNLA
jgi:predicted 3-demethylubiquinone-9 3-methyltransferase (glyoxalase superfamily)